MGRAGREAASLREVPTSIGAACGRLFPVEKTAMPPLAAMAVSLPRPPPEERGRFELCVSAGWFRLNRARFLQ